MIFIEIAEVIRLRLKEMVEIKLGTIVTRLRKNPYDVSIMCPTISMKQVSAFSDIQENDYENLVTEIPKSQLDSCVLSKENDVVLGLTSHRSMVITSLDINKLIPSNFVLLRPNRMFIDPFYLCWQLNEGHLAQDIKSQIQGTTAVMAISIKSLSEYDFQLPMLEEQRLIGNIYRKHIERTKVYRHLLQEENKYIHSLLNKKIGEIENEN